MNFVHQGESAILESFLHFCLLWKKGDYILVFIALVSTVHGVQPCLVRNWPVNHLCVCGSQAPHSWEILKLCLRRIHMWGWDHRGLGGCSGCSWRRRSFLLPSGAWLRLQPWHCHPPRRESAPLLPHSPEVYGGPGRQDREWMQTVQCWDSLPVLPSGTHVAWNQVRCKYLHHGNWQTI